MEAFALIDARDKKPKLYACGQCGRGYSPEGYGIKKEDIPYEERLGRAKVSAENCCKKFKGMPHDRVYANCPSCGGDMDPSWYSRNCSRCNEKARFEKAEKIPFEEYTGVFFSNGPHVIEGIDEFLEHLESEYDDPEDYPDYVWAAVPDVWEGIKLDRLLENELDEYSLHGELDPMSDLVDLEELQQFIEQWNEKQQGKLVIYHKSCKKAVVGVKEAAKKLRATEAHT